MPRKLKPDKWIQGYACAVAALLYLQADADSLVTELYNGGLAKYSEQDMINLGIDEADIEKFKNFNLLKNGL